MQKNSERQINAQKIYVTQNTSLKYIYTSDSCTLLNTFRYCDYQTGRKIASNYSVVRNVMNSNSGFYIKNKQSHYKPGQAQRVPGS